jgi:hypothetical protein
MSGVQWLHRVQYSDPSDGDLPVTVAMQRGATLPDFTLPDAAGNRVSSRNWYMRRNFVIAAPAATPDPRWLTWIDDFVAALPQTPVEDAIGFALLAPEWRAHIAERGGVEHQSQSLLLFDDEGVFRERLGAGDERGALLIADRYGVIFHAAHGAPDDSEMEPSSIPGWIEFIACRCS